MEFIVKLDRFLLILFIASVVAILTRRVKLPYTVGLVFTGLILAFFPMFAGLPFSKDLVFNLFLPPLIFEAAIQISWKKLRKESILILVLVTFGVCLSASVTALGMRYVVGWEWISALLFGALIAATDPVSVIATFNEAGIHSRIRLLVEAESLLNDGTAAVAFTVILAAAVGQSPTVGGIAGKLLLTIGGGIVCGALVAAVMLLLAGRTEDNLVKFTLSTVTAYGSFIIAEQYHCSGVLATLTAGLLIGNLNLHPEKSLRTREIIAAYWEYLGFLANSFIFIGIGVHVSLQNFKNILLPAIAAILFVLLGRMFAIYPCCALFARSELRVEGRHQLVLFWGGLRGALALALSVGLPEWIPGRETIISVTFAVVAFSIFVQGLSMTPLLRSIGEIPPRERAIN